MVADTRLARGDDAAITGHLFVIAPNNSGSTWLRRAVGRSPGALTLAREGQHVPGFYGPSSRGTGTHLLWACNSQRIASFSDDRNYYWEKTRRAWHFQAVAQSVTATVLVVSSPPFLLCVDRIAAVFDDARFLFLVRDPYAVLESICRRADSGLPIGEPDRRIAAARHIVACFEAQQRNVATHRQHGMALSYEEMCASPGAVAALIEALEPRLGRVDLTSPLAVKGHAAAALKDQNETQIARLSSDSITTANRVFDPYRELFDTFGYKRRGS